MNISNYNLNNFSLGAQNVSINDNGAYTGEISASQLKSFGVEYAIVGHSERRQYQKETNDEINKKVNNLLENDIIPILCIGETREERAIGTGIIPSNSEIEEVFQLIKKNFPKNKVLYGGSANEKNIDILNQCKIIDGYLLGGISLKPDKLKIFLSKLENR